MAQDIYQRKNLRLCSFIGLEPIVCCPGNDKNNIDSISEPSKSKISHTASESMRDYNYFFL